MCQFHCSICGEELKKGRQEGVAMMCQKHPWRRADGPPKTHNELLGLIVDNDNLADAATTITSADDIIIIDNETKNRKIGSHGGRRQYIKDEFHDFYLKQKKSSLLTMN